MTMQIHATIRAIALALLVSTLLLQQQIAMAQLSAETRANLIPRLDNASKWVGHISNIVKACNLAIEYETEEDVKICIEFYDAYDKKMQEIVTEVWQINNLLNVEIPYSGP